MPAHPLTESAFARRLLRDQAGRLVARRRVRGWDGDDVAQEVFVRLLTARQSFDPTRGGLEAFAAVVVDRGVGDLLRMQRAAKRTGVVLSFEHARAEEPADPRDPIPAVDRALDVAAVLARLPADLQVLAELLKHETVAAAARRQAVAATTLRRRVRELRAAFELHKLRDF